MASDRAAQTQDQEMRSPLPATKIAPWVIRAWEAAAAVLDTGTSLGRVLLLLYYTAILIGLILLYGKGDFSTPSFIYQEF